MNIIQATITAIASVESLHIVKFDFEGTVLSMMSLELADEIVVGRVVNLTVNPTYIALAKECMGIMSYSNQIDAKIVSIDRGELLSSVKLLAGERELESIITTESLLRMGLELEDRVIMLIKASELSIVSLVPPLSIGDLS